LIEWLLFVVAGAALDLSFGIV